MLTGGPAINEDEFQFRQIVVFDTFAEVDRLLYNSLSDHLGASRGHQAVILGLIINQVRGLRKYLAESMENMTADDMNKLIAKYNGKSTDK